ncbi:MAG: hypothetical protein WC683_07315 [bacterium]
MKEISRRDLTHMETVDFRAWYVWMRRIAEGTARIIEDGGNECQATV